jgi:ubiquinone/menaquinone biosynthesis C-methylase UbiE
MRFKDYFSNQARKPSGLFGRWVMSRIFDYGNVTINNFMNELLSLRENDHVLEIGFGTGKLLVEMAETINSGLIEGIDFSDTMVCIAEKKARKYITEGKVLIRQGDFENTVFNENSFDKICSANTVYFWPHPDNCLNKILKILKPGGKLILAFEDKKQLERRPLNPNVFRFYDQGEINHLLIRNGFSRDINILSRQTGSQIFHCAVAVK